MSDIDPKRTFDSATLRLHAPFFEVGSPCHFLGKAMKLFAFLAVCVSALMLLCTATNAQTPDVRQPSTESVTVTGQKAPPEAVIKEFVQSYAASAPALGKMAKWAHGLCPITTAFLPPTICW